MDYHYSIHFLKVKEMTMLNHVPFEQYNGHFIKNTVNIPSNGSYLLIESYESFEEYFGTAAIMGEQRKFVTPSLFINHRVFAVLKDYLAEPSVHSVTCLGPKMAFTYSMDKIETEGWTAHTPLIVSVPKSFIGYPHCTDFVFLKMEHHTAINSASEANSNDAIVGGWSNYNPVDQRAREIFEQAMNGLMGVHYVPFLYKTQLVAGTNYEFVCLSKVIYPNARWSVAKVSIFQPFQGPAECTGIRPLSPIENIENANKLISKAEEAIA